MPAPDPDSSTGSRGATAPRRHWRRLAGRIVVVAIALVALLAAIGLLLPREALLAHNVATIGATPAELFPYFDIRDGQRRLWAKVVSAGSGVPPMEIADLGGPAAGRGSRTGFFPADQETGTLLGLVSTFARGHGEIVESVPDRRVVYDIDFGFVVTHREIDLEPIDAATTRVTWRETLRARGILARYALLATDAEGPGFAVVLRALAELAEASG